VAHLGPRGFKSHPRRHISCLKFAKNEDEVKEILEAIWQNPEKDGEILSEVVSGIRKFMSLKRCWKRERYDLDRM